MIREEEIVRVADENYSGYSERRLGFIAGANWADKTMLDRACEWLKENIDLYSEVVFSIRSGYPEITLTNKFETAFRQAMEGE